MKIGKGSILSDFCLQVVFRMKHLYFCIKSVKISLNRIFRRREIIEIGTQRGGVILDFLTLSGRTPKEMIKNFREPDH